MKTLIITLLIIFMSSSNMQAQDIYRKFFLENNVVAHRGAWKTKQIPQNSVESLREAFRLGCAGSEFDVQMTSDSVLVLCHNGDFFGKTIETNTFAELSKTRLSNGETIPTLDRILAEGMKQSNTRLFLEIKMGTIREHSLKSVEKTVKMVNKLGANPWVFYICFDYEACNKIRELSPHAVIAYLNGDVSPERLAADKINGLDYTIRVFDENALRGYNETKPAEENQKGSIVQRAKDLGLSLNVWTVNSPEGMDKFMEQGFDYITTDEPELLLSKHKQTSKSCYIGL